MMTSETLLRIEKVPIIVIKPTVGTNTALGIVIIVLLIILQSCSTISLKPVKLGQKALEKGDYNAAYQHWMPLAQRGVKEAQNKVGVLYEQGLGVPMDLSKAVKWYTRAAKQGSREARETLARLNQPLPDVTDNTDAVFEKHVGEMAASSCFISSF